MPTNTWDFPTLGGVLALALFLRGLIRRREEARGVPLAAYSIWWGCGFGGRLIRSLMSVMRLEGPVGRPLGALLDASRSFLFLAAAAVAAFTPFFLWFGREGMGIGLVGGLTTPAGALLRFFGLFLSLIAAYVAMELFRFIDGGRGLVRRFAFVLLLFLAACLPWAAAGRTGAPDYASLSLVLLLLLPGFVVLWRNRRDAGAVFSLLLVLYGLAIVAACELFHIRDFLQGGVWKRMNTIFKFYIPVWFFFSIGGAYILSRVAARGPQPPGRMARLIGRLTRTSWWTVFSLLVAASSVFTVMGPRARTTGDDLYPRTGLEPPAAGRVGFPRTLLPRLRIDPTLDGLAWMRERLPDECEAVEWLRRSVGGQPVIAEATLEDYRYEYARISSNTGLPAVLGWWSHVDQRGYPFRDIRRNDVSALYRSDDPEEIRTLAAKSGIDYVCVGATERRAYTPAQLAKFDRMPGLFRPAFRNKTVTVYRLARAPAPDAGEAPAAAGPAPASTAAPKASLRGAGEGEGPGEYREPRGIAVDVNGNVYVADFRNARIQRFGPDGLFIGMWGRRGSPRAVQGPVRRQGGREGGDLGCGHVQPPDPVVRRRRDIRRIVRGRALRAARDRGGRTGARLGLRHGQRGGQAVHGARRSAASDRKQRDRGRGVRHARRDRGGPGGAGVRGRRGQPARPGARPGGELPSPVPGRRVAGRGLQRAVPRAGRARRHLPHRPPRAPRPQIFEPG